MRRKGNYCNSVHSRTPETDFNESCIEHTTLDIGHEQLVQLTVFENIAYTDLNLRKLYKS